jgi:ankyrin repeat protein
VAASNDAFRVAALLIERGAEIDPVESNRGNTPLDFAIYGQQTEMTAFLSRFSRDVFLLTFAGSIDRLRELLRAEPDLAKAVRDGSSLFMWLPDDEARAFEAVELLLAFGADPSLKNKEGMTAAEHAAERALYDVADLLRAKAGPPV